MKIAMMLRPEPGPTWKLARQAGVEYAVTNVSRLGADGGFTESLLADVRDRFAEAGLELLVHESDPMPMDRIKLGLPGRDEDIERYCEVLGMMGAAGIPIVCYNFMAVIGWFRTRTDATTRGGALTTSFDYDAVRDAPLTDAGVVEEERMWDNLAHFLERAVPAAEAAGVRLAMHPDDPPVSPLRGIGRILTSPDAVARALALGPSDSHGVALCQGTFASMGADVPAAIRRFGARGQIAFAHFRDVRGGPTRFEETFHDAGQTDMLDAMRAYREVGFEGPIRPDHGPTMEGENNERPGYGMAGRLFGVGYMKGLLASID